MTISLEPTHSSSQTISDNRAASAFAPDAPPAPVDALLGNYKRAPGHFAEGDEACISSTPRESGTWISSAASL